MNKNKHLLLWAYFAISACLPTIIAQNSTCDHHDFPALEAIYNATNGTNWTNSWDLTDCDVCNYAGITCNEAGRIISIDLRSNNLTGNIPIEISNLPFLTSLNLSDNQLSGNIPAAIGQLSNLIGLRLSDNKLDGNIPITLGNLTELLTLDLRNNQFTGAIPAELGNLIKGLFLVLADNQLTGKIPAELSNFGSLRENEVEGGINVQNNLLSGCYASALDIFCNTQFTLLTEGNDNLSDFSAFCTSGVGKCLPMNNVTSCDSLKFKGAEGQIIVSGLTASSKVEIIGSNTDWQVLLICDGDCQSTQVIPNLLEGEYSVKVNLVDEALYCYKEEKLIVLGDGTPPNGIADCDNLVFTGEQNQILVEGLTATHNKVEILGRNTDWQVLTICDGDCNSAQFIPDLEAGEYVVKINQSGNDGSYCYKEEAVFVLGEDNPSNSANCNDLTFTSDDKGIIVSNLTPASKVEIIGRNTDWQVVTVCDGDCLEEQVIADLVAEEYSIKVNLAIGDGDFCYREELISVEEGSGNRVSNLQFTEDLMLYPNPAKSEITLLNNNSLIGKSGDVLIYNALGLEICKYSNIDFSNASFLIDLKGYENGIYLLTTRINGLIINTKRFLLENMK